jgi:hypothetical protein
MSFLRMAAVDADAAALPRRGAVVDRRGLLDGTWIPTIDRLISGRIT